MYTPSTPLTEAVRKLEKIFCKNINTMQVICNQCWGAGAVEPSFLHVAGKKIIECWSR